jgi:hypothetical protein
MLVSKIALPGIYHFLVCPLNSFDIPPRSCHPISLNHLNHNLVRLIKGKNGLFSLLSNAQNDKKSQ